MSLQQVNVVEIIETEDVRVEITRTVATVVEAGAKQGPPGPPGPSGSTIDLPFSWGDASPSPIGAVSGLIVAASIIITTPFDGVGASLTIGTLGSPALIMPADSNYPGFASRYEVNPGLFVSGQLYLTIDPGAGATQGAGRVYLEVI